MKKYDKEKKLEKLILSITSSLTSHLTFTYLHSREGRKFHKKTIKEYAQDIKNLCDLL